MLDIINKLRQILPPRSKYFAILIVFIMAFSALLELCVLGLLMPLALAVSNLNSLNENPWLSKIYNYLNFSSITTFITCFAIVLIVFAVIKTAFNYFMIWSQSFFIARLTTALTRNLVANYVAAPYAFHLNVGLSEIMNRVQSIQFLLSQVCHSLLLIFSELMVAFFLMLMICFVIPSAAVLLAVLFVFSAVVYIPLKKKIERLGQEQYYWSGIYNKSILQAFGTIKEVKLSSDESYFIKSVVDARWNLCRTEKQRYDLAQLPRLFVELLAITAAMGILIFLVNMNTSFQNIIMYAAVLIGAMLRIMPSMTRIQYNLISVRGGVFVLNKLYKDLTDFEKENLEQTDQKISFRNSLVIENLTFAYDRENVFQDFSMEIKRKESVAIVGPSGSGKTTLIDLIMGFYQAQSGRILADGVDIRGNLKSWRQKIGYVSQNIYLLDDSIRSNIAFCNESDIDDAKVERAMKMAQIYDFVQTLPQKEKTMIGEMGGRLSGGQRQRLAIARALYQEPELLILDEATSALDNETESAFVDALQNLKGSLTIIMIAHRLSSIRHCGRTIELNGK